MTKEEKMKVTIDWAREGLENGENPIAASIWIGDELLSKAYTTEKKDGRLLVHAELNALIEADRTKPDFQDRKKMQLFSTLEPCLMCYGAAMSAYIGEIYYSLKATDDGALRLIRFDRFDSRYLKFQNPEVEGNILVQQAKDLWVEYMKQFEEDNFMYKFSKSIVDGN